MDVVTGGLSPPGISSGRRRHPSFKPLLKAVTSCAGAMHRSGSGTQYCVPDPDSCTQAIGLGVESFRFGVFRHDL